MWKSLVQTAFISFRFLFSGGISRFCLVLSPGFRGSSTISMVAVLIMISPTVSGTPFPHILNSVHYLLLLRLVTLTKMSGYLWCVYMCMLYISCVCRYMWIWMCIYVYPEDQRTISNVISHCCQLCVLRQGLSLAWNLWAGLGCLASKPGSHLPPSPQDWDYNHNCFFMFIFYMVLRVSCLKINHY